MPFNRSLAELLAPHVKLDLSNLAERSRSLFMAKPPDVLQHYTSLDGAAAIVSSRSIRLTKFTYLNDQAEFHHAVQLLRVTLRRVCKNTDKDVVRRLLEPMIEDMDRFSAINICVASFCEDNDLLSQWQSYGGAGKGVALGFSGSALTAITALGWAGLFRCVYNRQDQQQIVTDLVLMLIVAQEAASTHTPAEVADDLLDTLRDRFYATFLQVAFVLKNDHFIAEQEWRLVTGPMSFLDGRFQATVSTARISAYFVHKFTVEAGKYRFLKEITLGPGADRDRLSECTAPGYLDTR